MVVPAPAGGGADEPDHLLFKHLIVPPKANLQATAAPSGLGKQWRGDGKQTFIYSRFSAGQKADEEGGERSRYLSQSFIPASSGMVR